MNYSVFGHFQWIRVDANVLKMMMRKTETKKDCFRPWGWGLNLWTTENRRILTDCSNTSCPQSIRHTSSGSHVITWWHLVAAMENYNVATLKSNWIYSCQRHSDKDTQTTCVCVCVCVCVRMCVLQFCWSSWESQLPPGGSWPVSIFIIIIKLTHCLLIHVVMMTLFVFQSAVQTAKYRAGVSITNWGFLLVLLTTCW